MTQRLAVLGVALGSAAVGAGAELAEHSSPVGWLWVGLGGALAYFLARPATNLPASRL